MKRISLILVSSLIVGCSSNNIPFIKQDSIKVQNQKAQNAWDELDGKSVTIPNNQSTKNKSSNQNIVNQEVDDIAKSMLQTSDTIPNWFYSPPTSDKYFYGAGEGNNIIESKNGALNFIAGEIQTAISSSFSKSETYTNNNGNTNFYKSVRNKLRAEVQKINFTNIEIVKTVKVDNKIYVLLRVDKLKLFNSLKTKFEILDNEIDTEIKTSEKYSLLDQLITLNKIEPKISQAISQATILNTLNSNFDVTKYTQKYNSYLSKKTEILHKLTFSVTSNDLFGQKLIEVLNTQGYKISNHSNIQIKTNKQIRNSVTYGMHIARVTINIQVIAKNKILNSNSIECKGISNTTSQAIAKAANNFKQKLEKLGINKLLGFE